MKVFISADIEGVSGVISPEQCNCVPGNPEYETARSLMEEEVNAAIAGAFEGGATQVVVADSHGNYRNLRADRIDPRARLVQSKPRPLAMVEGIEQEQYDGLMMVGFHSAAGQPGVLAHTINGRAFYEVKINGEIMAEADLYAAVAAEHGTSVWLVTGDDQLEKWMLNHYPGMQFACVKRMISTTAAESMSPQSARDLIRSKAKLSVEQGSRVIFTRVQPPYQLELATSTATLADMFCLIPGVQQKDSRAVTYTCTKISDLIGLLNAFSFMSMAC